MGLFGGGGGIDLGPIMKAQQDSLALQKKMYNDAKGYTEPYRDLGTGSVNLLQTLLGVGGTGAESRDDIYARLKPQYTTTTKSTSSGAYLGKGGQMYMNPWDAYNSKTGQQYTQGSWENLKSPDAMLAMAGISPAKTSSSRTSIDNNALNSAVDEIYNSQVTPDNYGSLLKTFSLEDFNADPGYQFRLSEGNKALERAAAARGQYYNPSTVQALDDYSQNMASSEYQNAYNRDAQNKQSIYSMLMGSSGMGQNAVGQTIGAGQNYANSASQIYDNMANAQIASQASNNSGSMFGNILSGGLSAGLGSLISGGVSGGLGSLFSGGASGLSNPNIAGTKYLLR